ncbi:DNA methyltransferase [Flavobacterium sp.]|uniref:class I SAM-dependent DNA methyltransferase n=1 Tax=Flavobacterium sp. TaxID=239 RepID=UPI00286DD1D7|nr:DNA methyltransferase [Flavobacterium sp.]
MALSWNEIKERAVKFSKEWAEYSNEEADAKPFLVEFFNIFGIYSKKVATFEHRVKKLDERDGYIDLLWKGTILIEMKSRGKNLDKAFQQAKEYLHGLKQHELPKYILVSDFEIFKLYDLEEEKVVEFKISELVNNVNSFGFLLGYQKKVYKEQDPANIKAAELMGKLHDRLKEIGYDGHPLEVYLVRLLFCLFAEDTTIFNKEQFQDYITHRTNEDGSDLAPKLQELFQVLDTPNGKRFKNLDEQLAEFPYVNGKLFQEILPMASFDTKMRSALLDCCYIDWSKISPAIFGSMFQSVMNPKERRNLGAHYTSETNILKLIKPLFLDELWAEFESIKNNKNKLPEFHKKISLLKFLDPACGCGNFLVITYRELRLLEIAVLRALNKSGQGFLDVSEIIWLDVDMMCGIEYEEFPARIAEVAMWLIDHQMNMLISNEFGQYFARLPLKKSANIVHGNALQVDWETVISKEQLSYIIGNPPFYGSRNQSKEQKEDTIAVFRDKINSGVLDYVACWYYKASRFIDNTNIKVAFVSTNSVCQGIQVPTLWQLLINTEKIYIHFAHQTFGWSNEAKGNAAVYCVIIGFAKFDISKKLLFEYENIKSNPTERIVSHINPYLLEAKDIFILPRTKPLNNRSSMMKGNAAIDDGNFIFNSDTEVEEFKTSFPEQSYLVRKFIGSDELINNYHRYCLWLKDAKPTDIKNNPDIKSRVERIRTFRESSPKTATRKWAETPTLFMEDRQPKSDYLMIPVVSSELRKYIPIGFLTQEIIANYSSFILPNATIFEFGIISSLMHNIWIQNICGKLEGRIRYSNTLGYNNFPFPENLTEKQIKAIEEKAQNIINIRNEFNSNSLAELYDQSSMPPYLKKAHNDLDKAVDLAYRSVAFTTEANRMAYLFDLYEKYTADLFTADKPKKKK